MDPRLALAAPAPRARALRAFRDKLRGYVAMRPEITPAAREALRRVATVAASPGPHEAVEAAARHTLNAFLDAFLALPWDMHFPWEGPIPAWDFLEEPAPLQQRLHPRHPAPEREEALPLVPRPAHRQDVLLEGAREVRVEGVPLLRKGREGVRTHFSIGPTF